MDTGAGRHVGQLASGLGAWSISRTRLVSSLGTARGFTEWFVRRGDTNDVEPLLAACPDHYLLRSERPGTQEVIEVTGGAVLASRFLIDYSDRADVPIAQDADCPIDLAGWATTDSGRRFGAVRHQFRDLPTGGFEARLAIAFPAALPPWMITEHRWHLACEFSNWVTSYLGSPAGEA